MKCVWLFKMSDVLKWLSAKFDSRRYLYPIPYSEVIKNRNMVQNPKW